MVRSIIFLDESLDPKTEPWARIVRSISLREALKKINSNERVDSLYELALKVSKLSDFTL